MPDLSERSRAYREDADLYDLFSRREDAPGLVGHAVARHARVARALDLGCGTGKFTPVLAALAGSVVGLDRSGEQLAGAARRAPGCCLVRGDAVALPFPDGSFDLVLACWVLGTVAEGDRRDAALAEAVRVTAPGGAVLLVENAGGCAFERLRGRVDDPADRTGRYNRWLDARGFETIERVGTWFGFDSVAEARVVVGGIWGTAAGDRVRGASVGHAVSLHRLGIHPPGHRAALTPGVAKGYPGGRRDGEVTA